MKRKSVAIKKIEKAFDQRIYTKRTLRELKLLRLLTHENVMNVIFNDILNFNVGYRIREYIASKIKRRI